MFSTWGSTQDVGWVRYAFDHFEVNYDLIYKERIRQGNLRDAYDVIVIPSQGARRRQGAGLRHRIQGQAARLHQDARIPEPRRVRRIERHHRRHGTGRRRGARQIRQRAAAC